MKSDSSFVNQNVVKHGKSTHVTRTTRLYGNRPGNSRNLDLQKPNSDFHFPLKYKNVTWYFITESLESGFINSNVNGLVDLGNYKIRVKSVCLFVFFSTPFNR